VLEAEGLPVGIVTAINGASRFTIEVDGVAGHAGTVPMNMRRDALCAAAEMVLEAERTAKQTEYLVATVGRVDVLPGAVNVIPSGTRFTLDVRSPSDAVRLAAVARLTKAFEQTAKERNVSMRIQKSYEEAAVTCHPELIEQLSAAVERTGVSPRHLPSGAGHDGLAMVALCPVSMLFVRCKEGISHNPAESMTTEDADIAVRVLVDFLRHFVSPAAAAH